MPAKGSNQSVAKKANTALIKETIYRYAPISRVEISQMLRLTPPTVASNVNKLIADNIVYEIGTSPDRADSLGRKPILVDFIPDSRMAVGVELGPYRTTLVLTDIRGKLIACNHVNAAPSSYDSMLAFLSDEVARLIKSNKVPREKLLGLGIGLPGFIDSDEGLIHDCYRHNWIGKPLAADASELTGLPVRIENNVRARAIGAELFDRTTSADFFIYFFVSHGLACPHIIKDSPLYGKTAGTGEIGHMVISPDGPICETCGNSGCLEALASENAIIKRCTKIVETGLPTMLNQICADPLNPEISEILKAQESGDPYVCGIMRAAVGYLGLGLANVINLMRPHHILVDGQIFDIKDNQELLMEVTKKNIYGMSNHELEAVFLPFDPLRGAIGGSAIAIENDLKTPQDE